MLVLLTQFRSGRTPFFDSPCVLTQRTKLHLTAELLFYWPHYPQPSVGGRGSRVPAMGVNI